MPERTLKEMVAESARITGLLTGARLTALPYKRNPDGLNKDMALVRLSDDGKTLRVWPGIAEVTVKTNKKFREAVITLSEKERVLTRTVKMRTHGAKEAIYPHQVRNVFPIVLPDTAEYTWEILSTEKRDSDSWWTHDHKVSITATVPTSDVYMLVGYDETHQFVSVLPGKANSVTEAHDLLRPEGVPADALRQGEFFFVPVTPDEQEAIQKVIINDTGRYRYIPQPEYGDLDGEYGSTHQALGISIADATFVAGPVIEVRGRHRTLWLNGWHRVVRNTEVEQQGNQGSYD